MEYDEPYIRVAKSLSYGYHNPRKLTVITRKNPKTRSFYVPTLINELVKF